VLKSLSSRRAKALGLGVTVAVTAAALPLLGSMASADTPGNPATTLATTPSQTNIAPNGPLTNLSSTAATTIHIDTSAAAGTNHGFEARLCKAGVNITGQAGFVPLQGGNCADPGSTANQVYSNTVNPDASLTTASFDFSVTAGTYAWNTPGGAKTFDCTAASPCALWLKESIGSSTYFMHYDLEFAPLPGIPSTPAAPTVTLTGGGTTAHVVWTAPAASPAIDDYLVTPYIGGVAQAPVDTASTATTRDFPGLTNFSSYTFTVTAHNSVGNSAESPQSAPPVVPTPAAPPAPNATSSANGTADVTFGSVAGATGYVVTPLDVTTSTPGTPLTVASSPAHFTGLTDGDNYTFSFHAVYGANNGTESAASAPVKIGSRSVSQTIIASRPAGTLDIAEACANGYTGATFDASSAKPINPPLTTTYAGNPAGTPADGPQFGLYPQTCDVNLGTGVLNSTSTYYVATGAINPVSVRDLRDGDLGWQVNTQLTNFNGITPGHTFAGDCLQFTPAYTELSNTALYTQKVHVPTDPTADAATTGTAATPIGGSCAPGTGVNNQTVQTAAATGGLGVAQLDGALTLNIPVSAPADTYAASLTFTVLGN